MLYLSEYWMYKERLHNLQKEAALRRLIRRALATETESPRFYKRTLAWLGRYLIAWGHRLAEYGTPDTYPEAGTEAQAL